MLKVDPRAGGPWLGHEERPREGALGDNTSSAPVNGTTLMVRRRIRYQKRDEEGDADGPRCAARWECWERAWAQR